MQLSRATIDFDKKNPSYLNEISTFKNIELRIKYPIYS